MVQTAPKYSKIEITLKFGTIKDLLNETSSLKDNKLDVKIFEDCGLIITGNHLLIIEDNKIDEESDVKYSKQTIFDLSDIKEYKAYSI